MSKRCELQKEYYKEFGSYKGDGKYSDHYVEWLENEVLALRLCNVVGRSEQLVCPLCDSKVIVSDKRHNVKMCGVCKHQWAN